MSDKLTILACQIDIPATDNIERRNQHLTNTANKASKYLGENPADILLLPELSSLDYSSTCFGNLDKVAEDNEGESFQTWSDVAKAHGCWVLYGFAKHKTDNTTPAGFSIATGVIEPDGSLYGIYEKLHLAQFGASEEKDYFSHQGDHLLVFNCNGFTLAPIICYDIRFAELCRTLSIKHQVDCILHTGAYARDPSFDSWHAFVKTRAMENQVYMVSLNRAGDNFGHSVFMPPWVDSANEATVFSDKSEEFRLLTLRKQAIENARREYHFISDALPNYDLPVSP